MTSTSRNRSLTVPIVIAVAAALIAAFVFFGGQGASSPQADQSQTSAGADKADATGPQVARRAPHDPVARGDVDAPVVMVNYSDFQCPFCGKFARDTAPKLAKYVKDGTLRIEWRDFPYFGKASHTAAKVARAAGRQGAFWKMHDALFAKQFPPNSGGLTLDYMMTLAKSLGLDTDRLRQDMKDPQITQAIQKDFAEGQSIGVTGTPSFLINGQPLVGAQPASTFIKAIEQAAKDAR